MTRMLHIPPAWTAVPFDCIHAAGAAASAVPSICPRLPAACGIWRLTESSRAPQTLQVLSASTAVIACHSLLPAQQPLPAPAPASGADILAQPHMNACNMSTASICSRMVWPVYAQLQLSERSDVSTHARLHAPA